MGSGVALEIVKHLEKLGHQGKIILIDGAPAFLKELNRQISAISVEDFLLANTLRIQLGEEETLKVMVSPLAHQSLTVKHPNFRQTYVNVQLWKIN